MEHGDDRRAGVSEDFRIGLHALTRHHFLRLELRERRLRDDLARQTDAIDGDALGFRRLKEIMQDRRMRVRVRALDMAIADALRTHDSDAARQAGMAVKLSAEAVRSRRRDVILQVRRVL